MNSVDEIRISSMIEAESLFDPRQSFETYFNIWLVTSSPEAELWEVHFEIDVPGIATVSNGVLASGITYGQARERLYKEIGVKIHEGWEQGEVQPKILTMQYDKTVANLCLDVGDLYDNSPIKHWAGFGYTLTLSCQELGELAKCHPGKRISKGAIQAFVELAYMSAEGSAQAKAQLSSPFALGPLAESLSPETRAWMASNELDPAACIAELLRLFAS